VRQGLKTPKLQARETNINKCFVVLHFKIISTLAISVQDPVLINGAWVQDLEVCNRLSCLEIRLAKYVIKLHSTNSRKNFDVSLTVHFSITQSMYQLDAPISLLFI
jgi:hypothetical protein